MHSRRMLTIVFTGLLLARAPSTHAGNCYIDNGAGGQFGQTVHTGTNGIFNGEVCGHSIYGTGSGGCDLYIDSDDSWSDQYTSCLIVGKGVTVYGGGHSLTCTSSDCASAIEMYGDGGSGTSTLHDLNIVGCFEKGITASTYLQTNKAYDINIDLAGSGCQGSIGAEILTTPERIVVKNASDTGMIAGTYTIKDSIVMNSGIGFQVANGGTLSNVLAVDNGYAIKASTTGASVIGSSFVGNDCDCKNPSNNCVVMTECVDFNSTPSHLDDVVLQ